MGLKHKPTINGKEVDLNLLYQIVTSHGGWEKVNTRNEWDDLLEHFHLPRGTNGGLVIKQIYLKYLETYEKIYFLGENVGNKEEADDEFDDIRNRRRHAHKVTSRSHSHIQSSASQLQSQQQQLPVPIPEHMREQLGLRNPGSSDYNRILLSLQSPLPNDQDMAISVCTLLSNETKHVLKFDKCPAILNMLLAHTGIYEHCGLRMLMEETYSKARDMNISEFWEEIVQQADTRSLLCESYVDRVQTSMGLNEEDIDSTMIELDNYEDVEEMELDEEDIASSSAVLTPKRRQQTEDYFNFNEVEKVGCETHFKACCSMCPCSKNHKEFEIVFPIQSIDRDKSQNLTNDEFENFPSCLTRSAGSDDKVGQRVNQIAFILRNLSFEDENASVMARNSTLLRYLIITANCSWASLPQMSFDILGNIAGHIVLQDPLKDPLSAMLLTLVTSGLFSLDRFKILRSLEVIRDLTKTERNEKILARYMEKKVYNRMCELLTICDIMLLIYTLECILSMTGIGEAVCNELVRVKGSVATLVSLVTVEAQSYGPKGCILMRVVETVTGSQSTQSSNINQQQTTTTTTPQTSPSTNPSTPVQQPISPTVSFSQSANSIQAIGLRTVTGHTIIPPAQQQTGNPSATLINPSTVPPITLGAVNMLNINAPLQQQQFRTLVRIPSSSTSSSSSVCVTPTQSPQVQVATSRPTSSNSPSLHRSSSPSPGLTPVAQVQGKPGSLPIMVNHLNSTPSLNSANNNLASSKAINPIILFPPTTSSSNNTTSVVNNINHVKTNNGAVSAATTGAGATPVVGGLAQVSSHSLTQHVYTPCISLVTQKGTLSEEAWATAWLNGGFESSTGTSIEQDKFYSLYCSARKCPGVVLSMEQLVQCVKNVYGASVGPVMKTFGSTSLTFIEGIRPKITLRPAVSVPVNNNSIAVSSSQVVTVNSGIQPSLVASTTNGGTPTVNQASSPLNSTGGTVRPTSPAQLPVSVHIPSPLSPILKATLSRPPTAKTPTGAKRGKAVKLKEKRSNRPSITHTIKKSKRNPETQHVNKTQTANKIMSPASSAIRSLLASKVAQRQQKKLLQQQTKNFKKGHSTAGLKTVGKTKGKQIKMNGIDIGSEKGEESSASSSINSTEESEVKADPATVNFQGILCNGVNTEDSCKESLKEEAVEIGVGDLDELGKNSRVKGMLVDLLERKVSHKDTVNGMVGREIRISDKGLELIEKQQSGSTLLNNTFNQGDMQEPQQMTFYASTPEVVSSSGQTQHASSNEVSSPSETVLLSGGGNVKVQLTQERTQVVKVCKMLDQAELESDNSTLSYGAGGCGGGDGNSIANIEIGSNGGSNGAVGGGGDLLEKFNQFSDLIVVNPEQLGLKRLASTPSSESSTEILDQVPPAKKPAYCMNGSDVPSSIVSSPCTISTAGSTTVSSVLQAALSLTSASPQLVASTTNANSCSTLETGKFTVSTKNNNNQMVHLPVRLSVNPQNPQQLTFSSRQMVLQPGQQFLLSTGNSQTGIQGLQGQVIISKPPGSSGDSLPKAILLIQTPNQQQSHQSQQQTLNHSQVSQSLPLLQGQSHLQTAIVTPNPHLHAPINQLVNKREGVPPNAYGHIPMEALEQDLPYLCEWASCGFRFSKYQQVFMHAITAHCPDSNQDAIRCEWGANGCDPLLRKRYSVMTHLQDRHCSKQALELACYRRKNKIEPPPAPQQSVHHPGYAPNAAFHAIKRHALQFMNPKEMMDENEGPVTKSIRLTAALILRNLVNYSSLGRKIIGGYESQLSAIAMSNVESSRTIAQLLHDMSEAAPS